jgi:ATP-dependent RNA helicase RhlE
MHLCVRVLRNKGDKNVIIFDKLYADELKVFLALCAARRLLVSFEVFDFDASIVEGIRSSGYTTPTPVQEKTIPGILKGRDVMGLAQTGTGKTAAFVLPMLQRLMNGPRTGVRALIIAPTRELAEQTHEAIQSLGRKTGFRSMTIYGGASMVNQIKKLRSGVNIIVACPGRLLDHIGQGTVDLSAVEMLVLDEADRMLDMGFMPDIRRILNYLPKERQTLLFSATMPDDIRTLTRKIMNTPVVVQVDHSMPAKTVSHALYPIEQHLKTPFLISLLRDIQTESVLVFTRTKARTRRVTDKLQKQGFRATPLQGNMPQSRRQESLKGFRDGKYQILVATDIAARGVDISSITHVINYDIPDTADAYTHRVGRTGRAARKGQAFTLVTQEDAPTIRSFERVMGVELVCRELEGFDYNAPKPAQRSTPFRRSAPKSGRRHNARAGKQ